MCTTGLVKVVNKIIFVQMDANQAVWEYVLYRALVIGAFWRVLLSTVGSAFSVSSQQQ